MAIRSKKLIAEINITPFTDVILVLLIIFMITTPLLIHSSIEVSLPNAAHAAPVQGNRRQVDLTITNESVIYLDDKLVTQKELKSDMTLMFKASPDIEVLLRADKRVRVNELVAMLDVLKEIGIKKVDIISRSK